MQPDAILGIFGMSSLPRQLSHHQQHLFLCAMAAVMARQVKDFTERLAQSRHFDEITELSHLITHQKLISRLNNTS
jgi:hypothetical protein